MTPDRTFRSLFARSCIVLHTESQICLLLPFRRRRTNFPEICLMFNFSVQVRPHALTIDAECYNQVDRRPSVVIDHMKQFCPFLRTEDGPAECSHSPSDVLSRIKSESHTNVCHFVSQAVFLRLKQNEANSEFFELCHLAGPPQTKKAQAQTHLNLDSTKNAAFYYSDTHHTNSQ